MSPMTHMTSHDLLNLCLPSWRVGGPMDLASLVSLCGQQCAFRHPFRHLASLRERRVVRVESIRPRRWDAKETSQRNGGMQ